MKCFKFRKNDINRKISRTSNIKISRKKSKSFKFCNNDINRKISRKNNVKISKRKLKSRNFCNNDKSLNDPSYFGEMSYTCKFCSAVFWKEDRMKSNCCHNGTIYISPLSPYNENLKDLLLHDIHFRLLIRYYNNLFCFATFCANVKNENQKAIYNLKIQGQVCHITPNTLLPLHKEEPICGQLYIYDDITSVEKRLKSNEKLTKEHLEILTNILNKNPYAVNFKSLYQLSNVQNLPNYKLYFTRKTNKQQHRYIINLSLLSVEQ